MAIDMRIRRRQLLYRLVSGGAVFCTFLCELNRSPAQAAPPRAPTRRRPLIVLDPGHGGRDPGASGVARTLEKDVTLSSALALRAILEANGRFSVEMTRSRDRFVRREDRADMARDLGASLFLSLHADRMPNASIRGASVYTLAPRASDAETEALANRENGVSIGTENQAAAVAPGVSEILASLAARETRAASSRIAHQLVRDLKRDLPVLPSPERHANFTVLRAAGIPSVLIEMGFLSNAADEAALNDAAHRELIARAMTRAVEAWFSRMREG
jgi:N-acetylmuramoyl-L-alanine amidase